MWIMLNISLSKLQNLNLNIGLYRDDGLATGFQTPRQLDIIKKKLCKIFKEHELSITIEANKKVVNFLDVTLDLNTGLYKPYMKPNDTPVYVNKYSNHPPSILKNIPSAVNKRLSKNSANQKIFEEAIPPFQNALHNCGYSYQMKYEPNQTRNRSNKNNHKRDIIWFNPPWSLNCKTKVGALFLKLVKTSFPPFHPLQKIFNRNTLKVSYSCMPNFNQVISSHNHKVRNQNQNKENPGCNCQKGPEQCPLNGACQTKSLVYGAKVTNTRTKKSEFYTGVTARRFKDRYYEHQSNSRHEDERHKTTLSEHIWKLRDMNESYTVSWWVIDRGRAFNPSTKTCNICSKEKFHIMFNPQTATLNSRREVFATCRHRTKLLLCNYGDSPNP